MVTRVLADANVLHSRTLRDWLLLLALESRGSTFTLHYTEDILAETIATIRRGRVDLDGKAMTAIEDKIRGSMTSRIEEYPPSPQSPLADAKDRHVHSAAVAGHIGILVTADRGFLDLAESVTDNLPYEILCPDAFLVLIDDSSPQLVQTTTKRQHTYWTQRGVSNLATKLRSSGCQEFADRVAGHLRSVFS